MEMTVPIQLLRGEKTEQLPDRSRLQSQGSPDMRRMYGDERPLGLPDPGDTLSINQLIQLVNHFISTFPIFAYYTKIDGGIYGFL